MAKPKSASNTAVAEPKASIAIQFNRSGLDNDTLLRLYRTITLPRLIEEKMLILLRQGRVSKWFSGIGQEAISVGVVCALNQDELLFPLHRNLGLFTGRGMALGTLFAQLQGKKSGFSKGRERSFHFGSLPHGIVGMISHLGPQLALACGTALAAKLGGKPEVSVAFTGDGGTSEGDFHEALNVASVWQLPVIFIIENNGYGLSTPVNEQYRCNTLADRAIGYGMEAHILDGNNILEVYTQVKALAEDMRRNPRPILLEMRTFRMRGHEEASGVKYVPKHLFEEWTPKDPVTNLERFLLEEGILTGTEREAIIDGHRKEIELGIETAFPEAEPVFNLEEELADLYAPSPASVTEGVAPTGEARELRLVDAIRDGLLESMRRHPNLVLMGQDIAEYGGVFKATEGFVEEFGRGRVRNTPLCESAIIGTGLGLSLRGFKAMVEMQFADFVTVGFNQIINNLAKLHWRWGANADVVVRMPTGAGVGAGPFHSQSNEAWFFHTPGLKVVYPSNPYDAKGLLMASFDDPNPIVFFEHKALYRIVGQTGGMVPEGYYTIPLGKAAIAREGSDCTVITYGAGVHWALEAAEQIGSGSVEIIDLRTLLPWDKETVEASVRKTGKALVLHEDCLTGGIGGEIAAWISEQCFTSLDAPVMRLASYDTPVPFAPSLEKDFLPKGRVLGKIEELLGW